MATPKFSSYNRMGMFEELCKGADPREVTAKGGRQTFDTLWQPSACGDKTSRLEALCHDLAERLAQVEKEIRRVCWMTVPFLNSFVEKRLFCWDFHGDRLLSSSISRQCAASDDYKMQETSNPNSPYQEGPKSYQEAFPGGVTQKELQEKEEYKKLKEKIRELEARNKELWSKAVGTHKYSENMNDPSRLSAVLQMYDMLRLHDWEKLRSSTISYLTYKDASSIIKKLFDACQKDVQQRTINISEALAIPPLNDTMTNSKQRMMQEIRSTFRYSYFGSSEYYTKIIRQAGIDLKMVLQRQFALQCCKIYCLLLLQDPLVKAVWNLQESSMPYIEHVDKKICEHWRKPAFLWPIMKCGEQVIVKGVVWDEK
ncbi:unnamed protein product [Bubo scandiacus]